MLANTSWNDKSPEDSEHSYETKANKRSGLTPKHNGTHLVKC
jgi:hypothetical protein